MRQAIQDQLQQIEAAGAAIAAAEYGPCMERAEETRLSMMSRRQRKREAKRAEEKTEKQAAAEREDDHAAAMFGAKVDAAVDHVKRALYFGLGELPAVPEAFQGLVSTPFDALNAVNRYNIVLATQRALKAQHPGEFAY